MPLPEKTLLLADLQRVNDSSLRTFDLARSLTARGIEVVTIASVGALVRKFEKAGLTIRNYYRIDRITLPILFNTKIIRLAQAAEPDIIHACSPRLSRLAARLARACRTKYVVTANSIAESHCRIRRSSRCGGIIVPTQFIREWLVNNARIPKEVITVIPNGVEVCPVGGIPSTMLDVPQQTQQEVSPAPTPFASPSAHAPVIGMMGAFASGEGHDCFLKAAAAIAEVLPNAQFVIAGDGSDRWVRGRAEKLGLVKRTTIIPLFLDFRHLLASIDVLLVPSMTEGHSRLILDAMACRRPVIASGVGENFEVIRDGETGILVPRNDCAALAQKAIQVLTDASYRRTLLVNAFEFVRNEFSLARMAKDTLAFYTQVLGE
ncbi:MAG TPA: glycosyltransferase family 4 protein [Planctomycetota bacterium]|nr:glycosyltransferase family 4 protein [Planctomycetota bacterium]